MSNGSAEEGWRRPILERFPPSSESQHDLTLVGDPDRIMGEQALLEELRSRGYDLLTYEDNLRLRYAYESSHRRRRDTAEGSSLVVIVQSSDPQHLVPFDLMEQTRSQHRVLHFSLAELFPGLSPSVIASVERSKFDQLMDAVAAHRPPDLGEAASKDFVLKHVYGWAPELIKDQAALLAALLRRHYRNEQLPELLDERLIQRLEETGRFSDWPLDLLIGNRQAFFAFLEERWPHFVARKFRKDAVKEAAAEYPMTVPGPREISFASPEVSVYIDNLFLEGHLTPTDVVDQSAVTLDWAKPGVQGEDRPSVDARFAQLQDELRSNLPSVEADHREWIRFGGRLAEWASLRARIELNEAVEESAEAFWKEANARFSDWMLERFSTLPNVPYWPYPALVHQIPHRMAHDWSGDRKVALLVLDGMGWSQWGVLRREVTAATQLDYRLRESGVFAWVPTVTPVSRQALFSGEQPFYFKNTITTTSRDEAHWRRFWESKGVDSEAVQFVAPKSHEPDAVFLDRLQEAAERPVCVALGAVVPTVDEMAHGAVAGTRGLQAQLRQWAEDGHLWEIVRVLLEQGFEVHITSDHGNVECRGVGAPNVGALVETRGARVKVFDDPKIRDEFVEQFAEAVGWPPVGLPEEYYPMLAQGRAAFGTGGSRMLSHGGISIDEVLVPYVVIEEQE